MLYQWKLGQNKVIALCPLCKESITDTEYLIKKNTETGKRFYYHIHCIQSHPTILQRYNTLKRWEQIKQKAIQEVMEMCDKLHLIDTIVNDALYFNDSSQYRKVLWSVLRIVSPELFTTDRCPTLKISEE